MFGFEIKRKEQYVDPWSFDSEQIDKKVEGVGKFKLDFYITLVDFIDSKYLSKPKNVYMANPIQMATVKKLISYSQGNYWFNLMMVNKTLV
jgi:hypothetical protein